MIKKHTIETLGELFQAWQAQTDNPDTFLQTSGLAELMSAPDLQKIINNKACFAPETTMMVYALMPIKIEFKDIKLNIFPQTFYRLNLLALKQEGTSIINIRIKQGEEIYKKYYLPKQKFIKENINKLRYENQKAKNPEQIKAANHRYLEKLSPEEKEMRKEKSKLRMRQYRETHPESIKKSNQKAKEKYNQLSEIEKLSQKIDARIRNKKYREAHKEEIAKKNKHYREAQDSEIMKQKQKAYNQTDNRKQSAKTYYEKHKQEILAKAKDNPQSKLYKQKYKAKKRFQEKTGTTILALLQALAEAKSK